MAVTMKTIDGGTVTSLDDAVVQNVLSMRQNGVLEGMGASLAGTTVTVQPGRALIYGRLIDVDLTEIDIPLTATAETGIVYLQAEPNGETPASIGVASAQGGVTPQQDDLINGGEIYQLVLATFAVNSTTVSNFTANEDAAISTPADFIIQRGTSGVWTYEKWNSGKAVCYGQYDSTITVNPGSNTQYKVALPAGLFVSITYANVVPRGTHAEALNAVIGQTDSSDFVFYIGSLSPSGTYTTQPYMEAMGTWK